LLASLNGANINGVGRACHTPTSQTGSKTPAQVRPDPLKVNGNILALDRRKGY
jgi:hypothetical protein